jgi:hypothetical protein
LGHYASAWPPPSVGEQLVSIPLIIDCDADSSYCQSVAVDQVSREHIAINAKARNANANQCQGKGG